jgi:DNA mismatch endonuclease (patch repair protein)
VHGCFWHAHPGCRFAKTPSTRAEFWTAKLQANVDRDRRAAASLSAMGWRVLIVWECSTHDAKAAAGMRLALQAWIENGALTGEISKQSLALG